MTPSSLLSAAVVCSDEDRLAEWKSVLERAFGRLYDVNPSVRAADHPDRVSAVFLHTGDRKANGVVDPPGDVVFVFSLDGFPAALPDQKWGSPRQGVTSFPVFRKTGVATFEVTDTDAREFAGFAALWPTDNKAEWPSACIERQSLENLQAIAVLCQGFLALHAGAEEGPAVIGAMPAERREQLRLEVTTPDWWSILASPGIQKAARKEWGGALPGEWSDVEALLRQIGLRKAVEVNTVAAAYSALVKRFRPAV